MPDATPDTIAAVDLGSNSFHMIVAQEADGDLQLVDRMREMTRLAAGLDDSNYLIDEVLDRAIQCLQRFGERLRGIPPKRVRVVGTNTLRKARNSLDFLRMAKDVLGHSIDIISGYEEARLIYLGVSHSIEDDADRRLVVDIGGGSTELIIGRHFAPENLESLYLGCVSMSQRYFGDGNIDAQRLRVAKIAARQELETIEWRYRQAAWDTAIGASGTCLTISAVAREQGWTQGDITAEVLETLEKILIKRGRVDKLGLAGLNPERAPVFVGGVAILSAVFEALGIERMRVSTGALREGLLYDLIGRVHREDIREQTITRLLDRYHVDSEQASRISASALQLLEQCTTSWELSGEEHGQLLRWASLVHEIGLAISHVQYHKHGSYLLSNLDLPGFARGEQQKLAALVRSHRRKFASSEFAALPPDSQAAVEKLCLLLRLAVLLHRRRSNIALPALTLEVSKRGLKLGFPRNWIDAHPLTQADLEQEQSFLSAANYKLKFK